MAAAKRDAVAAVAEFARGLRIVGEGKRVPKAYGPANGGVVGQI